MNLRFDPFEILRRTAQPETENLESGPAKVANSAKPPPTLATLATLAGGKLESEGGSAPATPSEWTPQTWTDHYDERVAIAEHLRELTRLEAEHQALSDTVSQWLTMHPPPATEDSDGCVHCGADLGDDGVPVLAGTDHTWLHSACHPPWLAERRAEAEQALRAMGVAAAGRRNSG